MKTTKLYSIKRPSYTLTIDLVGPEPPPSLPLELKKTWCTALRSGTYKQGKRFLHTATDKYCCLGILCELQNLPKAKVDFLTPFCKLPDEVFKYEYDHTFSACVLPVNFPFAQVLNGRFHDSFRIVLLDANKDPLGSATLAELNDEGVLFEDIAKVIEICF